MKKLCFLSMFFLLVGCTLTNNILYEKNPNCTGIKEMKVFQVVDGGALATTVAADSIIVYLPNSDKYTLLISPAEYREPKATTGKPYAEAI